MNMEKQAKKLMKSAKSNWSKAKRTYVCRSLKDLIKAYRACTTRSEERALVKKEAAHIRDLFREGDKAFRRQNIAKLLFFHMNGYPTDFGMTECIKLCASHKYSDKRVAYLGLMILVDETEEILMLMTNCLKQDLNSDEVQIVSLALNVLGDIASVEMVRDLMPEIEKHLRSTNPYIRKKAALAAVRAVKKLPREETSNVLSSFPVIMEVKSSAVHVSGAALISALCRQSSDNVPELRMKVTPLLISILREHLLAKRGQSVVGSNPDTVIGGVRNPFLQVKIISTLRLLVETGVPGTMLEDVSDVLAQVASNTDSTKIAGCAVLYECVRTIVSLNTESSLRAGAVSILGRFLVHKEATVRYIALQELTRVVGADGPEVLVNVDGYQEKILSGLKEADPTVRKRAMELVYRIANKDNVQEMMKEMLGYVEKSTMSEDLREGCWKVYHVLDRYGPSDQWKVETFIKCLSVADVSMPEELITSFIAMISTKPDVRPHAVRSLFSEALAPQLDTSKSQIGGDIFDSAGKTENGNGMERAAHGTPKRRPRLERLAMYILGEYGEVTQQVGLGIPEVLDAFERVLDQSDVVDEAWVTSDGGRCNAENKVLREVALTSLIKFTCRALVGSSSTPYHGSELAALPTAESGTDSTGLSALLGLPEPPKKPAKADETGLGTDLLATMGLGDDKSSRALVPASELQPPALRDDSAALLTMDPDDSGLSGNPIVARVQKLLMERAKSPDLETQQRACEYLSLLREDLHPMMACALAPMPSLDFESIQRRAQQREAVHSAKLFTGPPQGEGLLLDLLEDSSNRGDTPLALPPAGSELLALPPSNPAPSRGEFSLEDILGGGSANQAIEAETSALDHMLSPAELGAVPQERSGIREVNSESQVVNGAIHSTTIFESEAISITARFFKDEAGDGANTRADLSFTNKSSVAIHSFVFLLAVPKYIKLQMHPASSSEIEAGDSATQSVNLINSLQGQRPIQLRYRVEYTPQGEASVVQHQGVVSGLESL